VPRLPSPIGLDRERGLAFYGIVCGSLTMSSQTKDRIRRFAQALPIAPSAFSGL
jgi:hypothetical protein